MMRETIGFIGLGNIGKPMATHIARAGFDMVVYDIGGTVERAPDGAMAGTSAAAVTRRSTAIFLSLPTVESVAAEGRRHHVARSTSSRPLQQRIRRPIKCASTSSFAIANSR